MVDLEEFVRTELNDTIRSRIFQGILEGIFEDREILQMILNRFSIEINSKEKCVKIYDDIYAEVEPSELDIKSFFDLIKNNEI